MHIYLFFVLFLCVLFVDLAYQFFLNHEAQLKMNILIEKEGCQIFKYDVCKNYIYCRILDLICYIF